MKISVLCKVISGGTPQTSKNEYWNGKIPWISIKDFASVNRYVYQTEKNITESGLNNSATNLLKKDDIIISARGTVGEVALIGLPMAFNQSCYALRSKSSQLNQLYLYYWLKAHKSKMLSSVHGAVFDTVTKNIFDTLEIELPLVNNQQHIVDTINSSLIFL